MRTVLAVALVAAHVAVQAPLLAAPNTVVTNTNPAVRQIGANYFELLRQSQVWINLEPQSTEPGPAPILLNVTVAFPGRQMNAQPRTVKFRAQTPCLPVIFPLRVRQPILRFTFGGVTALDLTAEGAVYSFIASCGSIGAPADTVATEVPFDMLRKITAESNVGIDALGFSARLTAADLSALRTFTRTVAPGVDVR
jgi:hypothetical protein